MTGAGVGDQKWRGWWGWWDRGLGDRRVWYGGRERLVAARVGKGRVG